MTSAKDGPAHIENGALLFCLRIARLWDSCQEVEYSLILRCLDESRGTFERVGALHGETGRVASVYLPATGPRNITVSDVGTWPHGMYDDVPEKTATII